MRSVVPEWLIVNDDWLIIVAFAASVGGLGAVLYFSTVVGP